MQVIFLIENPTYFSDKSAAAMSLSRGISLQSGKQAHHQKSKVKPTGTRRKHSLTSCEDTEDGSELETFLSSCESNSSYNNCSLPKTRTTTHNDFARIIDQRAPHSSSSNNAHIFGSLRKSSSKKYSAPACSSNGLSSNDHPQLKSSGMSSLTRLGQLFKKSKSKNSVGSESHASTVDSSGIGSPTCTPDSSLSIYTNSLDGESHSSSNSNQISPKLMGESMEDKFCSTYTFDDCGIFAANMYYNVGESSVFTIYHQHNNGHANNGRSTDSEGRSTTSTSRGTVGSSNGKDAGYSVKSVSDPGGEFEDCVQPYYNNTTFSTFPNPKRCSVASAASTTTSSVVPVPIPRVNENRTSYSINGNPTTAAILLRQNSTIPQDGDGYLRPNEARNLRNVKNLYINDAVIANANRNGQVHHHVQVEVHTPKSASLSQARKLLPFSETNNDFGGGGLSSSACSSSANSGGRYQFDSSGSNTSAATTLLAGGSHNFCDRLPEDENVDETNKSSKINDPLPFYMNRAYFGSSSTLPTRNPSISAASSTFHHSQRILSSSISADCEPYCSLCASSIMGSPRRKQHFFLTKFCSCFAFIFYKM